MKVIRMSKSPSELNIRKEKLKRAIEKLHQGASVSRVKEEFKDILRDATPLEISKIEQEMVEEGIPREKIESLCSVHLELFKDSLQEPSPDLPETHPIYILMQEHKIILSTSIKMAELAQVCADNASQLPPSDILDGIMHSIQVLQDSANHYEREENVLFPRLEAHGIVQPPAIMWSEHDTIRGIEKTLFGLFEKGPKLDTKSMTQLKSSALSLSEILSSHFFKENNILFQTSLKLFSEEEWKKVRRDFDDIGYGVFKPKPFVSDPEIVTSTSLGSESMIQFETGALAKDTLESLLNTLPIDITFVDENDRVRYFSQSPERIFVRAKSVIGREVRKCHPQKSVDKVEQILHDFRTGKRSKADFWINMNGVLIYIRYLAVRNQDGKYLGCLEVTQNITEIKKIEGEKRLLASVNG
jgi:PAS domain S-box-containing protein